MSCKQIKYIHLEFSHILASPIAIFLCKMEKLCHRFYSISSPMPYYYYQDCDKTLWSYDTRYKIIDPPDGVYIDVPEPRIAKNATANESKMSLKRTRTVSQYNFHSTSNFVSDFQLSEKESLEFETFLCSVNETSNSIMKCPYFPSDLFLLMDRETLLATLKSKMCLENWQKKEFGKSHPLQPELIFVPGKKTLTGKILKSTDEKIANLSVMLTKICRRFIVHSENALIPQILNRLEGHIALLPEVVVYLIIETDSKISTHEIKNAWTLMTVIISRYKFDRLVNQIDLNLILRSYFSIVVRSNQTAHDIINFAAICLFRLSCKSLPFFPFEPENPLSFVFKCNSPKQMFGVSIRELIFKEKILNPGQNDHNEKLVPSILIRMIDHLKSLDVFQAKYVFHNHSESRTDKYSTIEMMNMEKGQIISTNVYTVASIVKHFFRNLQEPLIPYQYTVQLSSTLSTYKCIKIANSLPNEHHDTLMYFIGFLQELALNSRITYMSEEKLAEAFSTCLSRNINPEISSKKDSPAIKRFLLCLIQNWNTEEVYTHE